MEAKKVQPERVCPHCNEKLEHIDYVKYGTLAWNDAAWEESEWAEEVEYSCPFCKVTLTRVGLVNLGLDISRKTA